MPKPICDISIAVRLLPRRPISSAACLLPLLSVMLYGDAARAQRRYIDGVFVQTPQGPVELLAYAEPHSTGILELTFGSIDDVPTLESGCRVLVSLPAWRLAGAIFATEAVFEDFRTERRDLRWSGRQLNIYATDLELRDLREPKFVAKMLRSVKASEDNPAYVFVVVNNGRGRGGLARFYPIRIDASTPEPARGQRACGATQ